MPQTRQDPRSIAALLELVRRAFSPAAPETDADAAARLAQSAPVGGPSASLRPATSREATLDRVVNSDLPPEAAITTPARPLTVGTRPQSVRGATMGERVGSTIRSLYDQLAQSLPGQVTDTLGVTGFAGMRDEMDAPPSVLMAEGGKDVRALRAKAVLEHLQKLAPEVRDRVVQEITATFPRLDKFGKPSTHLTPQNLIKRGEGLSAEAREALNVVAATSGKTKTGPLEIQALVRGETHVPEVVVRKHHVTSDPNAKQIAGAPRGVMTRGHEDTRLQNYLKLVDEGVEGAGFYDDSGKAILSHMNDDPEMARKLSATMAATSSGTSVQANSGFGIKGHNQAMAGEPIQTGRFPTAMGGMIRDIYSGASEVATGKKRTPFTDALARGGGFMTRETPARPTNDIWQGEAFGYMNDDGSPLRRGFSEAEHNWMDRMSDRALAAANRAKLGGRDDWTLDRLQAAAWAGIRKRRGEPNYDFAQGFADNYAQGGRESAPGPSTQHLPGLLDADQGAARQAWDDVVWKDSGIYDAQGRDQIAAAVGAPVGRSVRGQGVFKGDFAPGVQSRIATGTEGAADGGRQLDAGSRQLGQWAENVYATLMGQDAAAFYRVVDSARKGPVDAAQLVLKSGQADKTAMTDILQRAQKFGGSPSTVAMPFTEDGVILINTGMPEDAFRSLVKDVQKAHGVSGGMKAGRIDAFGTRAGGTFDENNWQARGQEVGQNYYAQIGKHPEAFDRVAPPIAQRLIDAEQQLFGMTGGRFTLSSHMTELRKTIANEGWKGLERLAKKYQVPVALLASALGMTTDAEASAVTP